MPKADIDRYVLISLRTLMIIGFIVGLLLAFKITVTYFLPIVIASVFSMILEPMTRALQKIRIPRVFATLIAMLIFMGIVVAVTVFGVSRAVTELTIFYKNIPTYSTLIYESLTRLIDLGKNIYLQLPPEALTILQQSIGTLFEKVTGLITTLTTGILNTLTSLPGIFIFTLITLISTFFITKDKAMIKAFLLRQFSERTQNKIISLKDDLFVALIGFVKAQLIFITVTFIESFIGLSIIGIQYAFMIALLVALVDILPVLGTGSIYVPWAIFSLLSGNYILGFSLLGLWVFIFIVRYMIEPKVYGHQLGIHPLLALISVFAGLKLIGVAGLILGPATVVILLSCQKAGILPRFK